MDIDMDTYEDPAGIDSELDSSSSSTESEDEGEQDTQPTSRKWTRETNEFQFVPPYDVFTDKYSRFNQHRDPLDSSSTHLEVLKKFIHCSIVKEILEQTNLHAKQLQQASPRALLRWTELNEAELLVFLGLHLLTGIIKKPKLRDYWSTEGLIETPAFSKHMGRNRFEDILRCLHFSNIENPPENPGSDRLWKLGNFLPSLLHNFNLCINPGEYLCVDESLMAFKGRLSFRQYNPLKRSRFGIKYFGLVDCETKFLVKMIVYLGKKTKVDPKMKELCGIIGSTVIQLLEDNMGKNHKVVLDNWFNSPKLQEFLAAKKTFCLGTVRANRKDMPKITKKKLPKGSLNRTSQTSCCMRN